MDNLGPGAHLDLSNSVLGRGQLYTGFWGVHSWWRVGIILKEAVILGVTESVRCEMRQGHLTVKSGNLEPDAHLQIPIHTHVTELNKLFKLLRLSFFSCQMRMPVVLR